MNSNNNFQMERYDEYNFEANADFQSVVGVGRSIHSPSIGSFQFFRDDAMQSRMIQTTSGESVRPMTATGGAGFQSQDKNNNQSVGFKLSGNKTYHVTNAVKKSPQEIVRRFEKEINQLIEESSILLRKGERFHALQKALQALKKDEMLTDHRKSFSLSLQQGHRLTFATWFHLAIVYEGNNKYDKAVEAYEFLMKQKPYYKEFPVQIRVNIGNLYFIQGEYIRAIRMYRMALDQTLHEDKDTRLKIMRNIGNSFAKLGKLREAILNYEDAVGTRFDVKTFLNLISCYVQLHNDEKSKEALFRMINGCLEIIRTNEEIEEEYLSNDKSGRQYSDDQNRFTSTLHIASRLVANMNKDHNWVDNFVWVYEQLYNKFPHIAFEIEIERAVEHLQRGDYMEALKLFKSYENQDIKYKTMVAINLSFFYFLEGNYTISHEYADVAISSNKYNPYALVNKGNCLFLREDYSRAKECYLEAIAIQSSCFEAIYNLALTNARLGQIPEALQSFTKLHSVTANDPRVLYQVANLYEEIDDKAVAVKWFNVLSAIVPTDPRILTRLGQLFLRTNNESQSFHYHLESFRCFPSDIDVIGWLAIWFVKHEMIEKSLPFFVRASQIQPNEIKWKIMVATGYRKIGKDLKAFLLYKKILKKSPQNIECLQHLISICRDVGRPFERYQKELVNAQQMIKTENVLKSNKEKLMTSQIKTKPVSSRKDVVEQDTRRNEEYSSTYIATISNSTPTSVQSAKEDTDDYISDEDVTVLLP